MKVIARLFLLAVGLSLTGCRSVRPDPGLPRLERPNSGKSAASNSTNAADLGGTWHSIRVEPRPDRPKIYTCQKFNPIWWFENIDDPDPPEWYRPNQRLRHFLWYCRNPFHN